MYDVEQGRTNTTLELELELENDEAAPLPQTQ